MIRRLFKHFLFVDWVFISKHWVLLPYVFLEMTGCFLFFNRSWFSIKIIFVCFGFIFLCWISLFWLGILRFAFCRLRSTSGGIFFSTQLFAFFIVIILLATWNANIHFLLILFGFRESLFLGLECITHELILWEYH